MTDRMLAMFKQRPTGAQSGGGAKGVAGAKTGAKTGDGTTAAKERVA